MILTISIDTANASEGDLAVLAALSGQQAAPVAKAEEPKKAAPAAKKASAPKAEPKAPEPVEEPEEVEEDLMGNNGPTKEDAVALATKMVSEGKTAEVKAALGAVGATRVSTISDDKIAEFIAELS